jgi:DNA repair protein RadC
METKTYKSNISRFEIKANKTDFPKVKITTSKQSEEFIRQFYSDDIDIYESFFLLLLNRANITTGYAKISQGGITGTVVDIKIIAKYMIDSLASSCVLAHNHPSGNLKPSQSDIDFTRKTIQALKYIDSTVIDSLILTSDSYYSFSDNGIL